MRYSIVFTTTTLAAGASAHGIIRNIVGANGVSMPGLNIADGTPRDCASNACGSQADTAIIRDAEIAAGRSPMGWTGGHGDVDAEQVVSAYMGYGQAPTNKGASGATGKEDNVSGLGGILGGLFGGGNKSRKQRREDHMNEMRDLFSSFSNLPIIGVLGMGGKLNDFPKETLVADTFGQGAEQGMPTSDENGVVNLVYRQINQDGAGPLTAAIDPSSGGREARAFQAASMSQNVPGSGISGLSLATNTDYPIKVQMPEGMTCNATIAGVKNMCIVRVRNQALAGPFGGCAAFQQHEASRKRAVEYLKKRALEEEAAAKTE